MNGVRLSALMYLKPMTMNTRITAIFSATRKSLNLELPFVPRIKMSDSNTMSSVAGRLNTPPSAGQAVHAVGRCQPRSSIMMQKYRLHEMLTVMAAKAYSSTKSQPMIHATSSPMVK